MASDGKRTTVFPGYGLGFGTTSRAGGIAAAKVPELSEVKIVGRHRLELPPPVNYPPPNPSPWSKKDSIQVFEASPWTYYEMCYDIEMVGPVIRVFKIPDKELNDSARKARKANVPKTEHLFTMRMISDPDADKLNLLRRLRHQNILTAYEVFIHENEYYVISEDIEVSLEDFIVARPDEVELAAIISQVSINACNKPQG
jgi:hypothetical protein